MIHNHKKVFVFAIIIISTAIFLLLSQALYYLIGTISYHHRLDCYPSKQPLTVWETGDGRASFEINEYLNPVFGTINTDDKAIDVVIKMSVDESEITVYQYDDYQDKGTLAEPLEEWEDSDISSDSFEVNILNSTYFKVGETLVFNKVSEKEASTSLVHGYSYENDYYQKLVLSEANGTVYAFIDDGPNKFSHNINIYKLENDALIKAGNKSIESAIIYAQNGVAYYSDKDYKNLYSYDCVNDTETMISDGLKQIVFYDADNEIVCFPGSTDITKDEKGNWHILEKENKGLLIKYEDGRGVGDLYMGDATNETLLPVGFAEDRSFWKTEYGTLVHNRHTEGDHILFLVDDDGQVYHLFSTYKMKTRSAIAVKDDTVWLSFTRERKYLSENRENPEGTYMINLKDKSCVKISDNNYEKLFALEGGLYGLDSNGRLYKMDYEGVIVDEVVLTDK